MNKTLLFCISIFLLLTGCADSLTFTEAMNRDPVGFWYGLWHGLTIVISLIGSLFNDEIALYAIYNNGGWYDWGFVIGTTSAFFTTGSILK